MKLPVEFTEKMKNLLGDEEFQLLLESYAQPRYYGLRVNTLKISIPDFLRLSPFEVEPVPWTRDGFYYKEGSNPGKHPYYHAGFYYIQEPSAMLPGAVIDAQPGECVLDLCAAPGGKTVQMAAGMKGEGLLVANDINSDRVKALVRNIEMCGIRNAIVTNESPGRLAAKFQGFFDKILVDAPCSGEGMFRKDEEAARSWGKFKCEKCAGMQWDILRNVDIMLKPGGSLVYSTCTFSPEEDEQMISRFLEDHRDYDIVEIPKTAGIESGRPGWSDGREGLARTVRLWPHKVKGEGHFVALLKKNAGSQNYEPGFQKSGDSQRYGSSQSIRPPEAFFSFARENLTTDICGNFSMKGSNLYCLPVPTPDLGGLKVAKFGWYMGEFIRDKFEPSHSMVLSLQRKDVKNTINLDSSSREVLSYLKGETLMLEGEKGLTAVCVDGYTLGWAKQTGDMLKNLYPKGWRKMG